MKLYVTIFAILCSLSVLAQNTISIKLTDHDTKQPIPAATIIRGEKEYLATTDNEGSATISLPSGSNKVSFIMTGYQRLDTTLTIPGVTLLTIALLPEPESLEEVTIVTSTRNNESMENSPQKVEVLGVTELKEEAGIKPGNIASILGDVSGVQIQQSSATSGNSNVRIQGLDGRYTQILRDGMPLYDGFSGGFGILTVPPLDLKQIELIKGSASTLYGGGAIGGLINLVSKRPTYEQTFDGLVNATTLKEYNGNVYLSKRNKKIGYTMFAGYTGQKAVDVNKDGFSDVPDVRSLVIHPKLFLYPTDKTILSIGYSGAFDNRKGGDISLLQNNSDSVNRYYEQNTSVRHTGEYMFEHFFRNQKKLTLKGNISDFGRKVTTNTLPTFQASQMNYYNEASLTGSIWHINFVAGVNVTGDDYMATKPDYIFLKTYSNLTTGLFWQLSRHITERTTIDIGMRMDMNMKYGVFPLPRTALFHRLNKHWAARVGYGTGYKVPNPLVQQTIEYNPSQILPVDDWVTPEKSQGYNTEVNYKTEWGDGTSLFINQAFFYTKISGPIYFVSMTPTIYSLLNADAPTISKGSDTYVKLETHHWELYVGYTYTDARNTYLPPNTFIPLTPRHRGAFVLVKEIGETWRIGLEGSYVGRQYRYDYTQTPSYFFMAAMVQRNIGKHIAIVLNGENLLDYRMSKVESLYTGPITNPSFKPLWAPIDGRVVNVSFRWKL